MIGSLDEDHISLSENINAIKYLKEKGFQNKGKTKTQMTWDSTFMMIKKDKKQKLRNVLA